VITLLLRALAIAPNEVEATTFTISSVFNSCKPKVCSSLFDELFLHGFGWKLNFLILVSRGHQFFGEPDVFKVDLCN
jgi:hypothetical protein